LAEARDIFLSGGVMLHNNAPQLTRGAWWRPSGASSCWRRLWLSAAFDGHL
jgi:hypothetical protein